jgi:cell division protein ZapA
MAEREEKIKGLIVQIFGDEYQISSQNDPAEVQRIAAYVDRKMKEIAQQHAGRVPKASLAVLAAMEITSELFGAVSEQSQLAEKARENLERLNRLVDARADIFSSLVEDDSRSDRRALREQRVRDQDSKSVD